MLNHSKLLNALTTAWQNVAPTGLESNIHVLTQREIRDADGFTRLAYPSLVFYADTTEGATSGAADGRRAPSLTAMVLSFRDHDYEEAWNLAEAYRHQMEALPSGLGFSGWTYAADDVGLDLAAQDKVVPRKVAVVEFVR